MPIARDTLCAFLEGTPTPAELTPEQERDLFREGLLEMAYYQRGDKGNFLRGVAREFRWRELVQEIDRELARQQRQAIVFKGGSALGYLYPNSGLRPVSDLDLLGDEQLAPLLVGLGFRTAPGQPWILHRGAFQVDLHVHPLGRQRFAFPWDLSRAIRLRQSLSPQGGLFRFQPEDETLIALIHAGKHAYSRWIWLADIHLLLGRCRPDCLGQILREAKAERYLGYAQWLLAQIQGKPVPSLSGLEQKLLRLCLQRRASESLGMLLPLFSISSPWRATHYLWHCLRPQFQQGWQQRLRELWHLLRTFMRSSTP